MLTNIKSALVNGILMAILGVAMYVLKIGDVFQVNGHAVINIVVMAIATAIVTFVQGYFTTPQGKFAGVIQVK